MTVGYWDDNVSNFHGLVMSGGKVVQVDYPGPQASTWLYGINKWGSVVGAYIIWPNGNFTTGGFKLQNGHYTQIKYPNSNYTRPEAINNNGVIVGWYSDTQFGNPYLTYSGFVLQNGTYKTINNPKGNGNSGTQINDINDSGVMVGNWIVLNGQNIELPNGFIYRNGTFEAVNYPGASGTSVYGINDYGTIVGTARIPANNGFGYNIVPYKAYCK